MNIENYKIIRSRRRTVALEITREGSLVVRAPYRAGESYIGELVANKARWIVRKIRAVLENKKTLRKKEFIEGEEFMFLGKKYRLKIVEGQHLLMDFRDEFLLSKKAAHIGKKVFAGWYKKMAREIITQRTDYYANLTGLKYKNIRITGATQRWGSCSFDNNLNFGWRLVMAPIAVVDYVVVHEICHIMEKNHSRNFWDKVQGILPDFKERRKWLRNNSQLFNF